jgi:polysaccharide deacetylase 2 family uncharacterized protein YibQ
MLLLDDEEAVLERPIGIDEPPPRRSFNWRPLLLTLAVVAIGGGLGTGGYYLSNLDTRDVIGMLDVADKNPPRLAMEMPGRPAGDKEPGSALTPPAGPQAAPPPPPPSPAPPAEPALQSGGIAPMPQTPPLKPEPAAPPPIAVAPPPVIAPPAPAVAALPSQPVPRNPDQTPSYAALPARAGEVKPLAVAPVEALVRLGAHGPLPVIGRDGRQPWQAYARPFDDVQDRPRLAVVVTGLGLDKEATEAAIAKLPPEVTLAFSPYAGGLDKWIKKARDGGHEVMLMVPCEASGFPARDPGPWGLLSTAGAEENITRLEKVLARAVGYVGVWAPDGPFVKSAKLQPVLTALKERGLLYLGDGVKDEPRPPALAPLVAIDSEVFRDAIDVRLGQAAAAAPQKGRVVVTAAARPVTFDRLITFLAKLPDQGIALAPVSAVVRQGGKS